MNHRLVFIILFLVFLLIIPVPSSVVHPVSQPDPDEKEFLRYACFSDTHIGSRYQYFWFQTARNLDDLGRDLTNRIAGVDFAVNLGDMINHNTAHVNGIDLPLIVNQYRNNLKAVHINRLHLPFHGVLGNHDLNDYQLHPKNPHRLVQALIDETCLNTPVYAMMRDGILFLVLSELGYVQWTHPVIYSFVDFMTNTYPETTTIIFSHQAIEDTTNALTMDRYHGKQDMSYWPMLFQENPQIKMWVHGHNHYPDWYQDNHSDPEVLSKMDFGHEMVFSAPYAQMDLNQSFPEDRIVVYTVSSDAIQASSWDHTSCRGRWMDDYRYVWNVSTSFDPDVEDWYLIPLFLQDNETQEMDMKMISPEVSLQLVGIEPLEWFYDSGFASPPSREESYEGILGFGNDTDTQVSWMDPGMKVTGPKCLVFPMKHPHFQHDHEDGRSGPLYHSFPLGTICAAVPGQSYQITLTGNCSTGQGRCDLVMSCTDWTDKNQYQTLENSEQHVFSPVFSNTTKTITGVYTVPENEMAWFLEGTLCFQKDGLFHIDEFSITRLADSETTEDFHLCLNDQWYNHTDKLMDNEYVEFMVDPIFLSDQHGQMNITAVINGNRNGMVNLIYHEPLFTSRNRRFCIESVHPDRIDLLLTQQVSKYNPVFEVFPFSTDACYEYVDITGPNDMGRRVVSRMGNIMLSYPQTGKERVPVSIHLQEGFIDIPKPYHLYLFDRWEIPIQSPSPVIVGPVTITLNIAEIGQVIEVVFFVDDQPVYWDDTIPFNWTWDDQTTGQRTISVQINYQDGTSHADRIDVITIR